MTAHAAAIPCLIISATTEYLTNNYHTQTALEFYGRSTRLEAHLHRTVEVFLLPVRIQPLRNEVREEDRRDCMKGHGRVIDPR